MSLRVNNLLLSIFYKYLRGNRGTGQSRASKPNGSTATLSPIVWTGLRVFSTSKTPSSSSATNVHCLYTITDINISSHYEMIWLSNYYLCVALSKSLPNLYQSVLCQRAIIIWQCSAGSMNCGLSVWCLPRLESIWLSSLNLHLSMFSPISYALQRASGISIWPSSAKSVTEHLESLFAYAL